MNATVYFDVELATMIVIEKTRKVVVTFCKIISRFVQLGLCLFGSTLEP